MILTLHLEDTQPLQKFSIDVIFIIHFEAELLLHIHVDAIKIVLIPEVPLFENQFLIKIPVFFLQMDF